MHGMGMPGKEELRTLSCFARLQLRLHLERPGEALP